MFPSPLRLLALMTLCLALLAGCESAEERAARHAERGATLLAAEDPDRAILEFRSALRLNDENVEARLGYAHALEAVARPREAVVQYLALLDIDTDHAVAHRDLALLALRMGDLEALRTHGARAVALAPDDIDARALGASVALVEGEFARARKAARDVLADDAGHVLAHRVLILDALRTADTELAGTLVDRALAAGNADDRNLNQLKLVVAGAREDAGAVEAQLAAMAQLFPDDPEVMRRQVAWHLARNETDKAEAALRAFAGRAESNADAALSLIAFLERHRGPDQARAEADRLATQAGAEGDTVARHVYVRAAAEVAFRAGDAAPAIARMQELAADPLPAPGADAPLEDEALSSRAVLAGMLGETGHLEDAAALVDEVLQRDRTFAPALKLRAAMALERGDTASAISDLRTALDQAPEDSTLLLLLGQAHLRDGAWELAGERLALAAKVSGHGETETLAHAAFLSAAGQTTLAAETLDRALETAPGSAPLLAALARARFAAGQYAAAETATAALNRLDTPAARAEATRLSFAAVRRLGDTATALDRLEALAGRDGLNRDAVTAERVRLLLREDRFAEAAEAARALSGSAAGDLPARMLQAGVDAAAGRIEAAEEGYRGVIRDHPSHGPAYLALHALLLADGRDDAAEAFLDEAIESSDGAPVFLGLKARQLEARGDATGAIAIHEQLHARAPDDPVAANNLAALLAEHGDGEADLARAQTIARGLRGSRIPHFRDTYGWILARRGDPVAALSYLEPAARDLPENPLVQAHLGLAYDAAGRPADAARTLEQAVRLAEGMPPAPELDRARKRLAELVSNGH